MDIHQITVEDWCRKGNELEILKFVVRDIREEVLAFLKNENIESARSLLVSELDAALRYPNALMSGFMSTGPRASFRILTGSANLVGTGIDQKEKSYYILEDHVKTVISEDGFYWEWESNFLDSENIQLGLPNGSVGKEELEDIRALMNS
jgi:hypothetical protein